MPRFSIIIPCFNAEATLAETLDSLMAQEVTDWEAICVDDGSTDATATLLLERAKLDSRIRLARNPGKGPSDARNHGALNLARGEIIAFCDADDLWVHDKLASLSATFEDRTVDGAFGRIGFFMRQPGDSSTYSSVPAEPLCIAMLLGENPVCTMSNIALRRDAFIASEGFDRAMVHNEDLDWLIRLVGQGARVIGVPQLHTWYRNSAAGLSSDLSAMEAGRVEALRTAAYFGVHPSRRNEAIHQRYLARRALRLGLARTTALRHALAGVSQSPAGFLSPVRRGGLTLVAALCATVLPRRITRQFFSR